MEKVSIKKIVIQIGKNTFDLSLKDAMDLRNILNETFPEEKTVYIPSVPVVIERPYYPRPYWGDWQITWTSNSTNDSSLNLMLNNP